MGNKFQCDYLVNNDRSTFGTLIRILNIFLIPSSLTILVITFITIYSDIYGKIQNNSEVCMKNGECRGKTIQTELAETYHGCMETCQNKSGCIWISYNYQNKDCHLYSTCNIISFEVTRTIRLYFIFICKDNFHLKAIT